jgi:hypothetical protein
MKVKLLAPIKGYSHFEGEEIILPKEVAEKAIEQKLAELVPQSTKSSEEVIEKKVKK